MNAEAINPGWLTGRTQLHKYTGLSPRTISRLMAEGQIPHRRLSHKLVMFRITDVDRALASLGGVK